MTATGQNAEHEVEHCWQGATAACSLLYGVQGHDICCIVTKCEALHCTMSLWAFACKRASALSRSWGQLPGMLCPTLYFQPPNTEVNYEA